MNYGYGIEVTEDQERLAKLHGKVSIGMHKPDGFTAPIEFWLLCDPDEGFYTDYFHGFGSYLYRSSGKETAWRNRFRRVTPPEEEQVPAAL